MIELENSDSNHISTEKNNEQISNNRGVQIIFENICYSVKNKNYKSNQKKNIKNQQSKNNDIVSIDHEERDNRNFDKNNCKEINILNNVSGIIPAGEMIALLGPSGSGKSTLLDILAKRKSTGTITGKLLVNGEEIGEEYKKYCSYVTQEDLLLQTASVFETLKFYADLRLPQMKENEKIKRVEEVLKDIGLFDKADCKIGGILPGGMILKGLSGGEKKRVSIGCGLVTNPSLLLLDEPTSGLDSVSALSIMKTLLSLTEKGVTVVCSIHQPRSEIYHLFHKYILLLKGRTFYNGPNILNYLSNLGYECPNYCNPADFCLDTCIQIQNSSQFTILCDQWQNEWKQQQQNALESIDLTPSSPTKNSLTYNKTIVPTQSCSIFYQYRILVTRYTIDLFRNIVNFILRLLTGVIIGLFLAACFGHLYPNQNDVLKISGIIFFTVSILNLLPFCSISIFLSNREVFNSERASKIYHSFPFYLANITIESFVLLLVTFLITIITYCVNHLRWDFKSFIITFVVYYLIKLTSDFYIMMFANLTGKSDLTYIYGTTLSIIFILFMGFLVPVQDLPKSFGWLHYLNPLFFGFATIMVVQFKDYALECPQLLNNNNNNTIIEKMQCPYPNGNDLLKYYDLEDWTLSKGLPIIFMWTIFYFICGYIVLHKLNKEKR